MKTRLLIVLLGHLCLTSNAQQATGKAQQIIERMQQVYRTARTYQDQGEVISEFTSKEGKQGFTNKLAFTTAYDRKADQFRFFYETIKGRLSYTYVYLIWSANGETKHYWSSDKKPKGDFSLESALATAAGISGTSSRKITSYLFDHSNMTGLLLQRLDNVQLAGTEKIEEANCFVLKATDSSQKIPTTFWVDSKSFMIRKIEEHMQIPNNSVKTTISFRPIVNQPIAAKDLAFDYERYKSFEN